MHDAKKWRITKSLWTRAESARAYAASPFELKLYGIGVIVIDSAYALRVQVSNNM